MSAGGSLRHDIHLARQQRCRTARLARHRAHPDRLDDWRSAPPVVKRLKLDAVVLDPIDDLVGSGPDWALAERVCAHLLIRPLGYDADDRRRPGKRRERRMQVEAKLGVGDAVDRGDVIDVDAGRRPLVIHDLLVRVDHVVDGDRIAIVEFRPGPNGESPRLCVWTQLPMGREARDRIVVRTDIGQRVEDIDSSVVADDGVIDGGVERRHVRTERGDDTVFRALRKCRHAGWQNREHGRHGSQKR